MQKRDRQGPPGLRSRTAQIDRARAALVLLGYGINDGEFSYDARVGALAVPVLRDNRVVASLNVIYLRSVITTESAVERFHGPLSLAASRIEAGMRAMLAPVTDSAHGPVSAPDECAVAT